MNAPRDTDLAALRKKIAALRKHPDDKWPQFGPGIPECAVTARAAFNAALDQVDDILRSETAAAPALDVGLLTLAMDAADPSLDDHEEEDHEEHLAYATDIAAEYERLRAVRLSTAEKKP